MKTRNITIEEELLEKIGSLIESRFVGAIRISNYVTLELFWKVGDAINQSQRLNPAVEKADFLTNISGLFQPWAGKLLDFNNLHNMQLFAAKFSKTAFHQIASYISWPHIREMICLESDTQIIFYARMAVEYNLTPQELNKKIASKTYESSLPVKWKFSDRPLFDFENVKYTQRIIPLMDYLLNPLSSGLRPLLEPGNQQLFNNQSGIITESHQQDIILSILGFINEFQQYLNPWLNSLYSMLHHEIGMKLNEHPTLSTMDQDRRLQLLREIGLNLKEKYGKEFSYPQLLNCLDLVTQYESPFEFMKIVALVRWEYIPLLSPLASIDEKLFYAKMIATEDWTSVYLEEKILEEYYLQNQRLQQKSNIQAFGEKEKSSEYAFENSDAINTSKSVGNIFENSLFIAFMEKLFNKN